MEFLYLLEKIRVPVLNEFMLLITRLGEETAFLVVALIVFWCVDKYKGYYVLSVGLVGTVASQFMKLWYRIPRPWILDENFTILEQAREAASGYSFPSGHSQSAVGTFGCIANSTKNKWVKIGAISVMVLVPLSRMYIGVHTPLDVLVGAALALALVFLLKPLVFGFDRKYFPHLMAFMVAVSVGYLCFVELYAFPADVDAHNLASGTENAYTLLGSLLGLVVAYILDEKWLSFSTKAVWWAQILKVLLGAAVVLAVKSGLKVPLNLLLGESVGRLVRYMMVVIVAGVVWPLTFKWFAKLGNKE